VADLPLSARLALEDMTFEDCVIQGLAMLNFGSDVTMTGCYELHSRMFVVLQPPYQVVGTYGMHRVTFSRCRFKDVGFILTPEIFKLLQSSSRPIPPDFVIPPHLQ